MYTGSSASIASRYGVTSTSSCKIRSLRMAKGFGAKPKSKYKGRLQPGKLSPTSKIPTSIVKPDYALDGVPKASKMGFAWDIIPQTPEDIDRMVIAGRIAREVLDEAVRLVKPGITTDEIDKLVHAETIARNSYPSPLNYNNFPKSCCTSINEVICHGIPDTTVLQSGDIINIDVTIYHDGVHGDCSETVFVGGKSAVSKEVQDLVITTYEAWQAAINFCKPGEKYSDIGGIIEDIIAPKGYTTVKEFCGHGVGRVFHAYPNVLHYRNKQKSGIMAPGHTFTIEPMICLGSNKPFLWGDDWTATTDDGLASAQFEHTLLITEDGVRALTAKLPDSPKYSWEE